MKYVIKCRDKKNGGKDTNVSGLVYFDQNEAQHCADSMNETAPSHIYYYPEEVREWERAGSW